MSEQPEFFTYTRDEFIDEFVHPDDRPAVEEAHQAATVTFGGMKGEVVDGDQAFALDPDIQEMFYGPDSGPAGEAGND